MFLRAMSAAIFMATSASAATLSFNGQTYTDALTAMSMTDYFSATPTKVGQSKTLRFYLDDCVRKYDDIQASGGYGILNYCRPMSWYTNSSFYTLSLDGGAGANNFAQNYFFSLTFAPTKMVDPDSLLLSGASGITMTWDTEFAGNEGDSSFDWQGAVAPVPLPASVGMLGLALSGLCFARLPGKSARRSKVASASQHRHLARDLLG